MASGAVVGEALGAAAALAAGGIEAAVLNIHTVKPIDQALLAEWGGRTGAVLTVEDHGIVGGLGSAVVEALSESGIPVRRHGILDFGESGTAEGLYAKHRLDAPGIAAVAAEPPAVRSGFGTLGRLDLNELLHLDFCVLPPAEAARPLWRPFSSGGVGALLFDASEAAVKLAHFLAWDIRMPVVLVGHQVPPELQGAPAGAASVGEDLIEAVRSLLLLALDVERPGTPPLSARNAVFTALLFGFVRGLGFAGGLREIGLPDQAVAWALLGFGGGVELGQIAFLSVALLVAGLARRDRRYPRLAAATAWICGSLATWWLFQRVSAIVAAYP